MKIALLFLFLIGIDICNAADTHPPNIVLIMADDLGAENLTCYGNTVHATPHLDRMASEALFNHAYASPVCTPTRAMIMTGLYPNRSGFLERLDSRADVDKNNRLPVHLKHSVTFSKRPDTPPRSPASGTSVISRNIPISRTATVSTGTASGFSIGTENAPADTTGLTTGKTASMWFMVKKSSAPITTQSS